MTNNTTNTRRSIISRVYRYIIAIAEKNDQSQRYSQLKLHVRRL